MNVTSNSNELPLATDLMTDRSIAIKVIGIGGAGANAVDRLKMENLERLQMAVLNTDLQALSASPVQDKVLLGASITRGLGAGGEPDIGRRRTARLHLQPGRRGRGLAGAAAAAAAGGRCRHPPPPPGRPTAG